MQPIAIDAVPINKPYTKDELEGRFLQGFQLVGQVLLKTGSGLSTPDNPDGKVNVEPCHLWVANQVMIPAQLVAQVILQSESKDHLCQNLFGMTLDQLEENMEVTE